MAAKKGNKYAQKYTDTDITLLCEEIMSFAEEDGTVNFISFARRKKKTASWINMMAEDYSDFAEAYSSAQEIMADKLVKASIYGHPTNEKFNGTHAMSWKNVYSNTQKKYDEWKASLTREQKDDSQLSFSDLLKYIKSGELLKAITEAEKEKK